MKIVKFLLLATGLLVGIIIAAFVVTGLLIPAERSFTNTVEINKPADKVWQVITDKGKFTEWQTNLTKVEVTDERNWIEYPKDSPEPLKFSLAKDERPGSMSFNYKMGDSFVGAWNGRVTPTATGTQLETTDSYVAKGWMTKILIYMFFDFDKVAKDWNNKLKQRVEKLD
jgi:uncharacterized membrane protein